MNTYFNVQVPKHNWQRRHNEAIQSPEGFEVGMVALAKFIRRYSAEHEARYERKIGDDYVLGPAFIDIVRGFRTLLNGECGRLDCGTLDGFACEILKENGEDA